MLKKLLFVIDSLSTGGAERSLVTLLRQLNGKYEIDLFLFRPEGDFTRQLPQSVHLLSPPPELEMFNKPFAASCRELLRHGHPLLFFYRCLLSLCRKFRNSSGDWSPWLFTSRAVSALSGHYDTAVGYLERQSIYFVLDKTNADKKIGWIHSDYAVVKDVRFDHSYYLKLDRIITVSEPCAASFISSFPDLSDKVTVFENLIDADQIKTLADEPYDLKKEPAVIYLATVARLVPEKGLDCAAFTCKALLKLGYAVRWLVAGEGSERENLEELIRKLHIKNEFTLLGNLRNPYNLIKNCDIYVQPSYSEGFGLTVSEALTLKKPVIATDIAAFHSLIDSGRNGILVTNSYQGLAKGIMRLIDDQTFRDRLSDHADEKLKKIDEKLFILDGIL